MYSKPVKGNNLVDIKDIPKERIKEWIDEYWESATDDWRAWFKTDFGMRYPWFEEWLKKRQAVNYCYCVIFLSVIASIRTPKGRAFFP
jgi:hypothetical protein